MKVTVEADSMEEAEQLVSDGWYKGEYILDAECFEGVEFESAEPVIDLSYREISAWLFAIDEISPSAQSTIT